MGVGGTTPCRRTGERAFWPVRPLENLALPEGFVRWPPVCHDMEAVHAVGMRPEAVEEPLPTLLLTGCVDHPDDERDAGLRQGWDVLRLPGTVGPSTPTP